MLISFQKPACATLQLADETYTSEDKLATRARHLVMITALNETKGRFTALPPALKKLTADTTKCTEAKNKPDSGLNSKPSSGLKEKPNKTATELKDKLVGELESKPNKPAGDSKDKFTSNSKDKLARDLKNKPSSDLKDKQSSNLKDKPDVTKAAVTQKDPPKVATNLQYRGLGTKDLTAPTCQKLLDTLAQQNDVRISHLFSWSELVYLK